jgi:hypothetical protein
MWQDVFMPKKRELLPIRRHDNLVVAGRCSICHRPFESRFVVPELASRAVKSEFDTHVCNEDANQAAARVVRESTKD